MFHLEAESREFSLTPYKPFPLWISRPVRNSISISRANTHNAYIEGLSFVGLVCTVIAMSYSSTIHCPISTSFPTSERDSGWAMVDDGDGLSKCAVEHRCVGATRTVVYMNQALQACHPYHSIIHTFISSTAPTSMSSPASKTSNLALFHSVDPPTCLSSLPLSVAHANKILSSLRSRNPQRSYCSKAEPQYCD